MTEQEKQHTDAMEEYNFAKNIRKNYPLDLNDKQKGEIIEQLPKFPNRDDMVGMALSLGYTFESKSELKLYYSYRIKIIIGLINKFIQDAVLDSHEMVGHMQGMCLSTYIFNFIEGSSKISLKFMKDSVKEIINEWKKTPIELFQNQKIGFIECLDIKEQTYTTYPNFIPKFELKNFKFVKDLIYKEKQ